jgi:TPR repeat protein
MYGNGDGVPQDDKTAVKWYSHETPVEMASGLCGDTSTYLIMDRSR